MIMLQTSSRDVASINVIVAALILGCAPLVSTAQTLADPPATQPSPQRRPFALVELFTSEGCSSCPPADRVLSDLNAGAQKAGGRVFILGFHVDYWNNLGWVDPYSAAAYSQRQQLYARSMRSNSVYTPQMIVNGTTQFVGSDAGAGHEAIRAALSRDAVTGVAIKSHWAGSSPEKADRLIVDCALLDAPAGSVVQFALVESGLVDHVAGGENAGRTLKHDNVARELRQHVTAPDFSIELNAPRDLKPSNASVIAFVQDPATMRILGADAVDLPPRP